MSVSPSLSLAGTGFIIGEGVGRHESQDLRSSHLYEEENKSMGRIGSAFYR